MTVVGFDIGGFHGMESRYFRVFGISVSLSAKPEVLLLIFLPFSTYSLLSPTTGAIYLRGGGGTRYIPSQNITR